MRYNISDRVYLGLKQLAQRHGIEKIILFGSRARGDFYEYSEEDIDALIILIRDSFIPALEKLLNMLVEKEVEAKSNSWDED